MTDPWSGWEAETVERGSKALNERDQARARCVALEQRLAEVRAMHQPQNVLTPHTVSTICFFCGSKWPCATAALIDAPLEATE